jgi:pimeloyl-ACP methyl ester carboxylesterase
MTAELPPVLLLHGFATSAARTWGDNGWIDILRDMGREVIAPDLLGHGDAAKPHEPEAYEGFAQLVVDELPDDGGPVDAIGFSMGARTLLALAVESPGRFRRLVLSGVGANLFRTDGSGLVAKALRGEADPSDPVARYFATLAQEPGSDPVALAAFIEHRQAPLTPEAVGGVTCPTLVVLGDKDFAGPADPLVEALPDARLVTLRNTDHFATPKSFPFMDAAFDFVGEP